jgi:hypothetical protein
MKEKTHMTRTCAACGIEKPLAAFLEISGTHGTRYGTICSVCRGAGVTEKKTVTAEGEQNTTVTTGTRIGLKEKTFLEQERAKQFILTQEENKEALIRREKLKTAKEEKTELKEKTEKDHRRTYLDVKKQPGFLGKKLPTGTVTEIPPKTKPVVTPPPEKKEHDKIAIEAKQKEMEALRNEIKNKTINLVDQYVDPQAGELRAHSPTFLAFQDSLEVTPFKVVKEQLRRAALSQSEKKAATATKDSLLDFVEKTWGNNGPSSTRRR